MKETTFIYTLSCPKSNLVRYIGKSNSPNLRFRAHLFDNSLSMKATWVQSLLLNDLIPVIDIIDEIPMCDWSFWEKHYIKLYKSIGAKLVNMNEGGVEGYVATDETKLRQRKKALGRIVSEETRAKISISRKGKEFSEAHKRNISNGKKGIYPEAVRKHIESLRGKEITDSSILKNITECKDVYPKCVSSYDLSGKRIKTFSNIQTAAKESGTFHHVISKICRNKGSYKRAKGQLWRFGCEEIITDIPIKKDAKTNKIVYKYDLDGNFIEKFITLRSAADSVGKTVPALRAVCDGRRRFAGGFHWSHTLTDKIVIRENRQNFTSVLKFDLNNNFIAEFETMELAKKSVGSLRNSSNISACCRGLRKNTAGFVWKYKNK